MSALKVSDHGLAARLVKARKTHWCIDNRDGCHRRIKPGEQYVRAVMFPNHDVYSYIDQETRKPLNRPIVHDMCLHCASHYDTYAPLAGRHEDVTP